MIAPEGLNSREVLAHLNSLGYQNISSQQLKEFIHDLKKLIKYEQKQNSTEFETSKLHCCYDCSSNENLDKLSSNESSQTSNASECSSSSTYQRELDYKKIEMGKKNSRNITIGDKVQASFIKPRRSSVPNDCSSKRKRSRDPVRLYQQYSECWKKLGVPGERKHSDLRWTIRCKMLGQEPQPRPVV